MCYFSRTQLLHPANKLELVFFPLYQNDNRIGSANPFSSAGAVLKLSRNRSGYMRLIKKCHFQMDFLVLNLSYLCFVMLSMACSHQLCLKTVKTGLGLVTQNTKSNF